MTRTSHGNDITLFERRSSRRQALKFLAGGAAAGALGLTGFQSLTASAQTAGGLGTAVSGTLDGEAFEGTLVPTSFTNAGGVLMAAGSILNAVGEAISGFTAEVTQASGGCSVLDLTLGPLNIDLLGLVIELPNPLVLTITAVPGSGKLLGNLLCAVSRILDGGGPLGAIAGLLNRILRLLG